MKIVSPNRIATETTGRTRQNNATFVAGILTNYQASAGLNRFGNFLDNVFF
jgi:hypothetical protein